MGFAWVCSLVYILVYVHIVSSESALFMVTLCCGDEYCHASLSSRRNGVIRSGVEVLIGCGARDEISESLWVDFSWRRGKDNVYDGHRCGWVGC